MLLSYCNGSVGAIRLLMKGEGGVKENRRLLVRKRERKKITLFSIAIAEQRKY